MKTTHKSVNKKKSGRLKGRTIKVLSVLAVLLFLGTSTTAAYLVLTTNQETNAFSVGTITPEIVETNVPDPDHVDWGIDTKKVSLKNVQTADSVAGVARVMLVPTVTAGEAGQMAGFYPLSEPVGNQMDVGDIILHFSSDWSSNWFFKDGYFYYRTVLQPGEESSLLLTGVTYSSDEAAAKYEGKKIHIEILTDILQADGQAPVQEWGVSMSGNIVTP